MNTEAGAGGEPDYTAILAGMEISTDDTPAELKEGAAPAAGEVATGEAAAEGAATGDPEPKPEPKRRARVAWGENGGFHIQPGEGVQVGEDGKIVLDGDVVKRIASKRIGQAHEQAKAAKDEAAKERAERERLEAEIQALRAGKPAATADAADGDAADDVGNEKPWLAKGAPAPVLDDFESVEAFMDARDEWKEAQARPAPPSRETETEFPADRAQALTAAVEAGKAKHADFLDVVGPVPLPPEMFEAVMESEHAADLLYHLGKDLDAAAEIAALSGKALARAIGKIEARYETAGPDGDDEASADATTGAPERRPAKPVPTITPVRPGAAPRRDPVALAAAEDKSGLYAYLDELEGRKAS